MNNSITIVGNVGKNPVSKTFGDTNNKVVKFSVAVKEYTSKSDEEKTQWFDVDAWNGLGERCLQLVTKGREVVATGRLAMNSYEKVEDGITVRVTKPIIKLTGIHVCGPKPVSDETPSDKPETKKKLALAKA